MMCQCPQRASTHFYYITNASCYGKEHVSMPSTGFYSFLQYEKKHNKKNRNVSMPSTGFYSFLPKNFLYDLISFKCVNALNGLLLISTSPENVIKAVAQFVSMPSTGFYSFLQFQSYLIDNVSNVSMPSTGFYSFLPVLLDFPYLVELCQCPQRASTHFYEQSSYILSISSKCVNALNGLLLISTGTFDVPRCRFNFVSMPSTGFYSFLQVKPRLIINLLVSVNALNGLLLIST